MERGHAEPGSKGRSPLPHGPGPGQPQSSAASHGSWPGRTPRGRRSWPLGRRGGGPCFSQKAAFPGTGVFWGRGGKAEACGDQAKGTQEDLPIGLQAQLGTLTSLSTSLVGVLLRARRAILLKQRPTLHLNSHPGVQHPPAGGPRCGSTLRLNAFACHQGTSPGQRWDWGPERPAWREAAWGTQWRPERPAGCAGTSVAGPGAQRPGGQAVGEGALGQAHPPDTSLRLEAQDSGHTSPWNSQGKAGLTCHETVRLSEAAAAGSQPGARPHLGRLCCCFSRQLAGGCQAPAEPPGPPGSRRAGTQPGSPRSGSRVPHPPAAPLQAPCCCPVVSVVRGLPKAWPSYLGSPHRCCPRPGPPNSAFLIRRALCRLTDPAGHLPPLWPLPAPGPGARRSPSTRASAQSRCAEGGQERGRPPGGGQAARPEGAAKSRVLGKLRHRTRQPTNSKGPSCQKERSPAPVQPDGTSVTPEGLAGHCRPHNLPGTRR